MSAPTPSAAERNALWRDSARAFTSQPSLDWDNLAYAYVMIITGTRVQLYHASSAERFTAIAACFGEARQQDLSARMIEMRRAYPGDACIATYFALERQMLMQVVQRR